MAAPNRNPEEEARERDRYVILLHIYTSEQASEADSFSGERILRDLGFSGGRAEALLKNLLDAGFMAIATSTGGLTLTPKGRDYIVRLAGRRRSVRLLR